MASIISNESLKDYLVRKFNIFAQHIEIDNLTEADIAKELNEVIKDLQKKLATTHYSPLEKGQALLYASQKLAICSVAYDESYRFYFQTIAILLDEEDVELVINEQGSSTLYELALSAKYRDNNGELLTKYLERIDNKEEIIFQPIVNPVNPQQTNDVITACIRGQNTAALTKILTHIKTKANKDQCWQQLVASNKEELIVDALKADWLSEDDKNAYLLTAARAGNYSVVKLLLEHGANIDHQDRYGYTALLLAARWGHTAIAQLLLEQRANIQQQGQDGSTAVIYAASKGHTAILALLLNNVADINHQNQYGDNALMVAARWGNTDATQLLIDRGANIDHQSEEGRTALMHASANIQTETMTLLLEHGADIDHQDRYGYTALMLAARGGNAATLTLLLAKGADVAISNHEGKTALELAQGDCLKILQEHMTSRSRPRP